MKIFLSVAVLLVFFAPAFASEDADGGEESIAGLSSSKEEKNISHEDICLQLYRITGEYHPHPGCPNKSAIEDIQKDVALKEERAREIVRDMSK